eukprot:SM001819S04121  [mRNA]  locus=s1819:83:1083:+ [translate_table: standard]
MLHALFERNLEGALEILDSGGVRKVVAERSGRSHFQVQGQHPRKRGSGSGYEGKEAPDQYTCFPSHYCSCASFFYNVVNKGAHLHCKHQLAARLAQALQCCKEVRVPDALLAKLLIEG